jgi:hypothetical protein
MEGYTWLATSTAGNELMDEWNTTLSAFIGSHRTSGNAGPAQDA